MEDIDPENDLAVITCADRNMLAAGCCTLLSARDNLNEPASFHLVALDISDRDRAAVEKFCTLRNLTIHIHPFESALLPKISKGRWSPAALTRLFLDQIGLPNFRRMLYLDADTLVVRSMSALAHLDLHGNIAAAVDDYIVPFPKKIATRRDKLGLGPDSSYFNSGVILFDWQSCLKSDLLGQARHNVENRHSAYHALDQDALNAALDGKWARLHPKWNAQTGFLPDIRDPIIVHFTGRRKPWQNGAAWVHREYSRKYAEYLAGTDWPGFCANTAISGKLAKYALHLGKKLEGLPKAGKIRAFLKASNDARIWRGDDI